MKPHRLVLSILFSTAALTGLLSSGCKDEGTTACSPNTFQQCDCPGGEQSMQECESDGSGWGECDCEEVTDECVGDACQDETGCCDEFACSTWWFYTEDYEEGYCYPMCDAEADDDTNGCVGDELCIQFDGLPLCVESGYFAMENLASTAGLEDDDSFNSHVVYFDRTDHVAEHSGNSLDFELAEFFMYEYEEDDTTKHGLVVMIEGIAGASSGWILWVAIPEDTRELSLAEGAVTAATDGDLKFNALLYWAEFGAEGIDELWEETALDYENSSITIHQDCEPCLQDQDTESVEIDTDADAGVDTENAPCTPCEVSFDLSWVGLSAKVNLSN